MTDIVSEVEKGLKTGMRPTKSLEEDKIGE